MLRHLQQESYCSRYSQLQHNASLNAAVPHSVPCTPNPSHTIPSLSLACSSKPERCEEPPVLTTNVPLLERLLDRLLRLLPLADLGESLVRHNTLEALELECVACGHQVVVVDDLDEGLDLAALGLAGLGHTAGDLQRVALDAGYEGVGEGVLLAAVVLRCDDDDFLAGIASARDDGLFNGRWLEGVLIRFEVGSVRRILMGGCIPHGQP